MEKFILSYNDYIFEQINSNLITVYHATNMKYDNFDIEKASPYNLYGQGIYFTDNLSIANSYKGGILNKITSDSHVKECILDISNFKNIYDKIEDKDIEVLYDLVYKNLVTDDDYDFWFKRIYSLNIPKKYEKNGLTTDLINRKELTAFAKKIALPENNYFANGYLSWYDVFGILTDNFNTIHSKVLIIEILKEKYNFKGWIINTKGDGLSNDTVTKHKIYCCFNLDAIKKCIVKKEA